MGCRLYGLLLIIIVVSVRQCTSKRARQHMGTTELEFRKVKTDEVLQVQDDGSIVEVNRTWCSPVVPICVRAERGYCSERCMRMLWWWGSGQLSH